MYIYMCVYSCTLRLYYPVYSSALPRPWFCSPSHNVDAVHTHILDIVMRRVHLFHSFYPRRNWGGSTNSEVPTDPTQQKVLHYLPRQPATKEMIARLAKGRCWRISLASWEMKTDTKHGVVSIGIPHKCFLFWQKDRKTGKWNQITGMKWYKYVLIQGILFKIYKPARVRLFF